MLLTDGSKRQGPTVHGRRPLQFCEKKAPQVLALFFLNSREQFGGSLALVGIFVPGDNALECRDR